jgi:hypothetical protein
LAKTYKIEKFQKTMSSGFDSTSSVRFLRTKGFNLFYLIPLFLTFAACDNDNPEEIYFWQQTKCADPWETGENDPNPETILAIDEVLKEEGIKRLNIHFDNNSSPDISCESCGCGTGQRILVTGNDTDGSNMGILVL